MSKAVFAIGGVFAGCMSNMVFLELLVKSDSGIGNLVTFLQFFFISIHGFIFTSKFGTIPSKIRLKDYLILVGMFAVANICNNMAFDYNIPVPLHMIFRAGSLIANMIMGILILKKKYSPLKYLSVFMITAGIIISTIVSSKDTDSKTPDSFFWWVIGITLLTVALFVSARMGIYQEWLYGHYGKHPMEALYYTHLLSLPIFLFLYQDIYDHIVTSASTALYLIPGIGISLPLIWVFLIGNVLTQYLCISSVYRLTTECSSLTVTLVVTLRKFASLLFSILYFQNPFTIAHWIGTILVFTGTLIFTEVPQRIYQSLSHKKSD